MSIHIPKILLPVSMRLKPRTVEMAEKVRKALNLNTLAATIANSIELADLIIEAMTKGSQVIIVAKNGVRKEITIQGINKK